jgi:hypothetical protein
MAATKHRHHELLLCLPSLLSPVRNIARVWHANETKKCRSTRVLIVMAMVPTLVRVFLEKNNNLQDHPDDPVSSEARRQGRGGASNGAECT